MRFEYWKSYKDGYWHWVLRARGRVVLARCGQGFKLKQTCLISMTRLSACAQHAQLNLKEVPPQT